MGSRKEVTHESAITRQTLDDPQLQAALQVLSHLLNSATGPHGRIQSIQNSVNGPFIITTSSNRLLSTMSFSRPCLRLIVAAVQGHLQNHHDGGLLAGSLCLHLVSKALDEQGTVGRKYVREVYEWMLSYVDEYINSGHCPVRITVDTADVKVMLAYVRSIINTKPVCGLLPVALKHLSHIILKAFVNAVPDTHSLKFLSDRVYTLTFNKSDILNSQVVEGLLLEWPEKFPFLGEQELNCLFEHPGQLKVAVVSVSMSGDVEEMFKNVQEAEQHVIQSADKLVMTTMLNFCDWLLTRKVGLLLCQKVIHPTVKSHLRLKGILFIERLGVQPMSYIQDLCGAHPISSIMVYPDDSVFGYLSSVSHRVIHSKSFLHIQKWDRPVCTLMLCCALEQQLAELTSVVQSALAALCSVIHHPFLLCGGGCWQVHTAQFIRQKVLMQQDKLCIDLHITKAQLNASVNIFTSSLESVARSLISPGFHPWLDARHWHLWQIPQGVDPASENTRLWCACGLLSDADMDRNSMQLLAGRQKWSLCEMVVSDAGGKKRDCLERTVDGSNLVNVDYGWRISNGGDSVQVLEDQSEKEDLILKRLLLVQERGRALRPGILDIGKDVNHDLLVIDGFECVLSAVHTSVMTAVSVLSISQYILDVN